jgi:lipoyl(octanoyl) transferase|tara:strand:- start:397 stop:834 length:438 start_codon:yes stop_codon:yes gene_type:complete
MLVSKNIIYINFNIIDYNYSIYIQDYLFNKILFISLFNKYINKISINNYIIFCQHNSVYTVGRNFNSTLVNNIVYSNLNIPFYKINRGGSITYHGLGQLIIYPVLNLLNFFKDINLYLRLLEQLIILILKDLNINAIRLKKFTGV